MKARSLAIGVACAAFGLAVVCPRSACAEGANIGLYTDVTGNTCNFTGNATGPISAYVVFRPDAGGVNTVQFSAPVPSCLGAVYLGETVTPGMMKLGSSQTGVSVLLQGCYGQPVSVMRIDYMRSGSTDPCCPYPILPDPAMTHIAASDCAYNDVPVTSVVSHFNADASCACEGNSPPSPPTTPIPQNASSGHSVTPQMSWFAQDYDNNIAEYDVYLGTSSPPALVASGLASPTFTPASPLAELTLHYWRVVVRDALGLEATGPVWSFTTRVANSPPFPPSNPVPASTAQDVLLNATLTWQGSDIDLDALTYDVYFGTTPSPPLVAANQTIASYVPGPLVYSTIYYWRVVARDDDLLETSGPEWIFTTRPSNYPPNAPSTPSPQNGATNRPVDLTLSWVGTDRDNDPLVYDLYFGTTSPPPLVASNLTTASFTPPTMPITTQHFWRVVARDTVGAETSGPTWSFTTGPLNLAPNAPSNPSPSNNSTNRPLNQTLAWTCSDPNNDPLTYDVYFGTSPQPPVVASNVATATHAPGPLASATRYYWRIRARDTHGATTLGPTWSFTTAFVNSPPNAPANPSPPDGATSISVGVTLGWTASDPDGGVLRYDVYFGTVLPPPLVASNGTASTFAPGLLARGTQYHWRIVVRDNAGATTSGPEWSFTTTAGNSPPATPSNPSPANGSGGWPVNVTLGWTCSDPEGDPLSYDVYFGTDAVPPLFASGINVTNFNPGLLPLSTTFQWRIVARDTLGVMVSGPTWSFSTRANTAPTPASNPWPANLGGSGPTPVLTWEASDIDGQELRYNVYFGTTSPPPSVALLIPEASYSPGTLQVNRAYYWRVDVSDGVTIRIGDVWRFTVRQPGDLVQDGLLTVADAACALNVFMWDPQCGGLLAYVVGDVDCSGSVTPRDARCIHQEVVDGSCDLCDQAVRPSSDSEPTESWATVSLASMSTREDTLIVRLSVSGIDSLEAFGFYAMSNPKVPLLRINRMGPTTGFTMLERHVPGAGTAVIGGYTLGTELLSGAEEFIELFFDVSHGIMGDLLFDGFVDDLAGAPQLFVVLGSAVDVSPSASTLALHQNHPNPFNPQTTITYDLPATSERVHVRLSIVDISGRVVKTLVDENQGSGSHRVEWQGKDDRGESVSSGVYFYVLDAGGERRTRKLVLLK